MTFEITYSAETSKASGRETHKLLGQSFQV